MRIGLWTKKILRWIGRVITLLVLLILIYLAAVAGFLVFPHQPKQGRAQDQGTVDRYTVYIVSNGVHTDFVFPVRSPVMDWTQVFSPHDFVDLALPADWIAIGWGDREFYLNTPTWGDLTVSRALHALFGLDHSLLHVSYYRQTSLDGFGATAHRLSLSRVQYEVLRDYVLGTVAHSASTVQAHPVAGRHYGLDDAFYEAGGRYSMLKTCNVWVGDGLVQADVRVSRWAPFDWSVVWYLGNNHEKN